MDASQSFQSLGGWGQGWDAGEGRGGKAEGRVEKGEGRRRGRGVGEGRRLGRHPPSAAGRAHRREDWSRWEPLVPPGGSQGLGPEPRVCAARTAFPEAQVTPPQAELRSQPRSPLLRGRTPEGSQLRAAPREARQRRRPATAGTKPPLGASGKLDQGGRPLPPSGPLPGAPVWAKAASRPCSPPAHSLPGLDRCVRLIPAWGRHSPNLCAPVLSKPWTLPGALTGGGTLSSSAGIF